MYWLGADGVFGSAVLPGILIIVFIETGLLFPLLPGESLLFTGGLLAAHPNPPASIWVLAPRRRHRGGTGRSDRVFHRPADRTGAVQEGRLPVLQEALRDRVARLLREIRALGDHPGPVRAVRADVRPGRSPGCPTCATRCSWASTSSAASLWGGGVTLAGYFLGNVPFVHHNLEKILLAILVVSLMPAIIAAWRSYRDAAGAGGRARPRARLRAPDFCGTQRKRLAVPVGRSNSAARPRPAPPRAGSA